jgi:hypothetical protein
MRAISTVHLKKIKNLKELQTGSGSRCEPQTYRIRCTVMSEVQRLWLSPSWPTAFSFRLPNARSVTKRPSYDRPRLLQLQSGHFTATTPSLILRERPQWGSNSRYKCSSSSITHVTCATRPVLPTSQHILSRFITVCHTISTSTPSTTNLRATKMSHANEQLSETPVMWPSYLWFCSKSVKLVQAVWMSFKWRH